MAETQEVWVPFPRRDKFCMICKYFMSLGAEVPMVRATWLVSDADDMESKNM